MIGTKTYNLSLSILNLCEALYIEERKVKPNKFIIKTLQQKVVDHIFPKQTQDKAVDASNVVPFKERTGND